MASFNKLLGQAFEAYNAGRNDEAEALCRKLVALEPQEGQGVLECPPPLQSLFEEAGCADAVIPLGQNPPPFDCYAPLMSLPRLFQTTLETIPNDVPYLVAPACQHLPEPLAGHLKVGLAWA
jgi:hypothetical protein